MDFQIHTPPVTQLYRFQSPCDGGAFTYHLWLFLHVYVNVCVCVCVHAHMLSRDRLCNTSDCSPPGFSVRRTAPVLSQARTLEWVAISSSRYANTDPYHLRIICDTDSHVDSRHFHFWFWWPLSFLPEKRQVCHLSSLVSPPVTRLLPGRGLQSVIPGSHTLTREWLLRWSIGRRGSENPCGPLVTVCLMSPGVLLSFQIAAPLSTKAAEKV